MILINGEKLTDLPKLPKRKVYELDAKYSRDNANPGESPRRSTARWVGLPTTYTMFDAKKNDNVEVRYALSDSPFIDQKTGSVQRKYLPYKIGFIGGIKVCEVSDPDLDFFLSNHPNLDKPGAKLVRFKLLSKEVEATESKQKMMVEYEAMSYIIGERSKTIEKQRTVLAVLSPSTVVADLTDDQIVESLSLYAKKDPRAFIKYFDSKETDYKLLIGDAQRKGYIELAENKWIWGANTGSSLGKEIVSVPNGRTAIDFFLEYLMRQDNTGVLNEIQILVEQKKPKAINADAVVPVKSVISNVPKAPKAISNENDVITDELKREAKLAGVPLQGIHKMTATTLKAKIDKAKAEAAV